MKTASRIEIRLDSSSPPLPRSALSLMVMIVCAVAAVSFTLGLTR